VICADKHRIVEIGKNKKDGESRATFGKGLMRRTSAAWAVHAEQLYGQRQCKSHREMIVLLVLDDEAVWG